MENRLMTLHLNQELFKDAIEACAQNVGMNALYIEKDYWVSYILKAISQSDYKDVAIFKGGTSLSKAYKLIERFSEDIDLAVITHDLTSNQIKTLIRKIEKAILDGNFEEIEIAHITSKGSEFRKTVHRYPKLHQGDFGHANENIILEINSFAKPHPYNLMEISSYVGEFLHQRAPLMVSEFAMEPFFIHVLDFRRTLCEKLSAIARASYESDAQLLALKAKIRHLYDIYFLMQHPDIQNFIHQDAFIEMIKTVREDDQKQFDASTWSHVKLSETPIFLNTSNILDQLNHHYITQFHDLVYAQTLPSINEIQKAINEVAAILTKEKL